MFKIIRDRIESGEPVNFQEAIELMSLEGHECIELFFTGKQGSLNAR